MNTTRARRHVLVVTGSYGAGHDSAAEQIRLRLESAGWAPEVIDIADLYPWGLGHLLRRAYFLQLSAAPRTWSLLLEALDSPAGQPSTTSRTVTGLIGGLPADRVARAVRPDTAFAISTHPFASQTLGRLRESGRLAVPAITYLTDASVHPLWVAKGVDQHLAVHEEAVRQARRLGAGDVRLIGPLTPEVGAAVGDERPALRLALGLSPTARVALISSGSQGAGDVLRAARDVRETGAAVPVVLCGHNERLRRRIAREPGVIALGWLDGLTTTLRGADCLIQNSGGFTTLEALALGVPLISYRPIPGHGVMSAEALDVDGLAPWPRTVPHLAQTLEGLDLPSLSGVRAWSERSCLEDVFVTRSALELAS